MRIDSRREEISFYESWIERGSDRARYESILAIARSISLQMRFEMASNHLRKSLFSFEFQILIQFF